MPERLTPLLTSADYLAGRCGVFDGETTCGLPRGHTSELGQPRAHRFHDPSGSGRWIDKDDFGVEVRRGPLDIVGAGKWLAESPLRRQQHPHDDGVDPADAEPEGHDVCGRCGAVRAALCHNDAEQAAGRFWGRAKCPRCSSDTCPGRAVVGRCTALILDPEQTPAAWAGREVREPGTVRSEMPLLMPSARSTPPTCGDQSWAALFSGAPRLCALEAGHLGMHRADDGMEWTHGRGRADGRPALAPRLAGGPMPERLRVGRSVGRTLYDADNDRLIGLVDSPELAAELVARWNGVAALQAVARLEAEHG